MRDDGVGEMADDGAMMEVEGRCLCGTNRYRVRGRCTGMIHCYCQRCRKAHGSSLASWTHFDQAGFEWLDRGDIGSYHSSANIKRSFCMKCGSIIPDPDTRKDEFGLPVGNVLRLPQRPSPVYHFYVGSRAPWSIIPDAIEDP